MNPVCASHRLQLSTPCSNMDPTVGPILQEQPWCRAQQVAAPQASCSLQLFPMGCSSGWALLLWGPVGHTSFSPRPLLYHGLLHGCTWRSALCGAHGLQGHSLLHHEPSLGCRELLCGWSTSSLLTEATLQLSTTQPLPRKPDAITEAQSCVCSTPVSLAPSCFAHCLFQCCCTPIA